MDLDYINTSYKAYVRSYYQLQDASIKMLLDIAQVKTVEADRYLINIGDVAHMLYFVVKGVLISEYIAEDGKQLYKNFFVPKNYAASTVSMITENPSDFGILAMTDCTLLAFNYNEYRSLIKRDMELLKFYTAYLEKNWVIENERKHIAFATQSAKDRYLTFLEEYPFLPNQINQAHIASYLGITPTQLSRIRKELTT